MNITKDTINIRALVAEIHACEAGRPKNKHLWPYEPWPTFCRERGLGRPRTYGDGWVAPDYAEYVTGLYVLRAFLRGKLHRKNPPAPIRDFHRSMVETGQREGPLVWDAKAWNRKVAEKMAERFLLEEAAEATG